MTPVPPPDPPPEPSEEPDPEVGEGSGSTEPPQEPGPGESGPGQSGPGEPGPVEPGPVEPGPVEPGPGEPGEPVGNGEGDGSMLDVVLRRIVYRDGQDRQYIYLMEREGRRGFPIVIGLPEAEEIRRVVERSETERPLTHRLCYEAVAALGASIHRVDIVDLRNNTFFATMVLTDAQGRQVARIDARPSDAIALALRANCQIRVAEEVMRVAGEELDAPG